MVTTGEQNAIVQRVNEPPSSLLPWPLATRWEALRQERALGPIDPEVKALLEDKKREIDKLVAKADSGMMMAWLLALNRLGRYPQSPSNDAAWQGAAAGLWGVCKDMPAGVWCEESRFAMLRNSEFFPTPRALYATLLPFMNDIKSAEFAVKQLLAHEARIEAQSAAASASEPAPTREEQDRTLTVQGYVREATKNLTLPAGPGGQMRTPPVFEPCAPRPRSRTDDLALVASLEQQLAAAVSDEIRATVSARLARLRAELGLPVPADAADSA